MEKREMIAILKVRDVEHLEYLLKEAQASLLFSDENNPVLETAFKNTINGQQFLSDAFSKYLLTMMSSRFDRNSCPVIKDSLTAREREIVAWIAEGLTSREIACKLNISADTVDTHRKNILKKLDLKNTAALVKYSILQSGRRNYIYP